MFPKFSDIERIDCLDAEVLCTGFTKQMSKDINLELGIDESDSETENDNSVKEDSSEDEFYETEDTTLEDDVRKSIIEMKIENDVELELTSKLDRMNSDCSEDNNCKKRLNSESGSLKANSIGSDHNDNSDHSVDKYSFKYETGSIRSCATTIHPDEIKKRVKRQMKLKDTKAQRKKCVAKGEASAVTRSRRDNMDTIKQSQGWGWD